MSLSLFSCGGSSTTDDDNIDKDSVGNNTVKDTITQNPSEINDGNADKTAALIIGQWNSDDGSMKLDFTATTLKSTDNGKAGKVLEYMYYSDCPSDGGVEDPKGRYIGIKDNKSVCYHVSMVTADELELRISIDGVSKGVDFTKVQ